jgi:hypothetical protein
MKLYRIFIFFIYFMSSWVCIAQWNQTSEGIGDLAIRDFAVMNSNIYAGAGNLGEALYFSSDNGNYWSITAMNNYEIWAIAVNGNKIFAGTNLHGIYVSSNNGMNWNQSGLTGKFVRTIAVSGNLIFAGLNDSGAYFSSDNGVSWNQTSLNNIPVTSIIIIGNRKFAGTYVYQGVFTTTDNFNWTQTSLNNTAVWALAANENNIYAGTLDGVYISTDNGVNWTQTSLNNSVVLSLAVSGNRIFAGSVFNGVYVSNDNGISWTQMNQGLNHLHVSSFEIHNDYLFAGTLNGGVYRRPLSELVGINHVSGNIPLKFELKQNYPNPFNPVTKISFVLPQANNVKLTVYDALGREVASLVNGDLNAGTHSFDWNANNFASGIYFYSLEAGSFIETKKMLLIK